MPHFVIIREISLFFRVSTGIYRFEGLWLTPKNGLSNYNLLTKCSILAEIAVLCRRVTKTLQNCSNNPEQGQPPAAAHHSAKERR